MEAVLKFLSGKKTFFVGGLMVALGILQNDEQLVLNGLGFIFMRSALKSVVK